MPPKTRKSEVSLIWFLVRDDKSKEHYVINAEKVQSPPKKKLKTGDSVLLSVTGDRSDRMREPIITIGLFHDSLGEANLRVESFLPLGSEDNCQHTLNLISDYAQRPTTNSRFDVDSDCEERNVHDDVEDEEGEGADLG